MEQEIGALEEGMLADVLLVDMKGKSFVKPLDGWYNVFLTGHGATSLFGHETETDLVHKFVFLADDRNIGQVWVAGQKVKDLME